MKDHYKSLETSHLKQTEPTRVLGRLLSRELTHKVSAAQSSGDMVCTGTQKGDKVQVDCVIY